VDEASAFMAAMSFLEPAMKFITPRLRHRAFQAGILFKGLDGTLEIMIGTALLLTTLQAIRGIVWLATRGELIEDPDDFFANLAVHQASRLSTSSQHFAGAYLLGHGIIKVALAVGLLRGQRWSYPTALPVLMAFICYQLYRLYHTHSLALGVFTGLDIVIVLLIWLEWKRGQPAKR
jgi:uncharacterized membrane protein